MADSNSSRLPIPFITLDQAEMLNNLAVSLIEDDRHDIGYTTYRNRNSHYYHGKRSPNHDSPWHHWQIGGILYIISQIAGAIALTHEMHQGEAEGNEEIVNSNLE